MVNASDCVFEVVVGAVLVEPAVEGESVGIEEVLETILLDSGLVLSSLAIFVNAVGFSNLLFK